MPATPDPTAVEAVRAACDRAGYDVDGLTARLGDVASRALLRDVERGVLLPVMTATDRTR